MTKKTPIQDLTPVFPKKNWISKKVRKEKLATLVAHQKRTGYTQTIQILGYVIRQVNPKGKSFEKIHQEISELSIKRLGPLMTFDLTCILTEKKPKGLFLHAGTKIGYKRFCKSNGLKFENKKYIPKSELPLDLENCNLLLLEDILCIYKDDVTEMCRQIELSKKSKFKEVYRVGDMKCGKNKKNKC